MGPVQLAGGKGTGVRDGLGPAAALTETTWASDSSSLVPSLPRGPKAWGADDSRGVCPVTLAAFGTGPRAPGDVVFAECSVDSTALPAAGHVM